VGSQAASLASVALGRLFGSRSRRNHALYCSKRREPDSTAVAHLFLFREFASEGIRLYLPESAFADSDTAVHSFIAALRMGLELRFRDAVDHLRVARDVRIAAGQEVPRQYLVIYDSVPGGTGYLKELTRDAAPLFEVFALAAGHLAECASNSAETRDGGYRCLYGYHNSFERRHVSRRKAAQLLARMLEHQGALKATSSVVDVAPNALLESKLERDFIEALRRRPADGTPRFDVREELVRGKPGYFLMAGDLAWHRRSRWPARQPGGREACAHRVYACSVTHSFDDVVVLLERECMILRAWLAASPERRCPPWSGPLKSPQRRMQARWTRPASLTSCIRCG